MSIKSRFQFERKQNVMKRKSEDCFKETNENLKKTTSYVFEKSNTDDISQALRKISFLAKLFSQLNHQRFDFCFVYKKITINCIHLVLE